MMEVINSKEVKTRKEHNCWGCGKTFPKGSKLQRTVSVDGGDIGNAYWCQDCRDYMSQLPSYVFEDGVPYGGIKEDRESYGLEYHKPFKPKDMKNVTI